MNHFMTPAMSGSVLFLIAGAAAAQTQYRVVELPVSLGQYVNVAHAIGPTGSVMVELTRHDIHPESWSVLCKKTACKSINAHRNNQHSTIWFAMTPDRALGGEARYHHVWWAVRRYAGSGGVYDKLTPGVAYGINTATVAVGRTADDQPFAYDKSLQLLPTLAGGKGTAYAINDDGMIVGVSRLENGVDTHAVAWIAGVLTDLGTLPQGTRSKALALNQMGVAAGCSDRLSGTTTSAVRFEGGAVVDLGRLGDQDAPNNACATAINGDGVIVGWSQVLPQPDTHPFIMEGSTMVDLVDRISDANRAKYALLSASAINNRGQIAVNARRQSDGMAVTVRLDPQN